MKKRILSLVLAVILALGVLPITAGAAEAYIWPLDPGHASITSYFGNRNAPLQGGSKNHKGIDIGAPRSANVYAIAGGTAYIGCNTCTHNYGKKKSCGCGGGYGNYVYVVHDGQLVSYYAHMTAVLVSNGQAVAQGQVVGTVGTTGSSTGNHLHLELRKNNTPVDPLSYVKAPGGGRPTLRSGSRGEMVKTLQTMLNAVSGAGLTVDGGFGSKTLAAVKSFQRSRGLAVDGVVGAKTWAALEAAYNQPASEPAAPTPVPVQPDPVPAAPDPAPAPDQSGKTSLMPSVLVLAPITEPTQGMPQGQPFYFKGSILSNYPIVFARVAILTADRVDAIQSKNIEPNSTLVDIATSGLDSLKFGKLQPGSYVLYLTATDSSGAVKEWSADFSIAANHATIRKGSKGDEVRLLQTMLNQIMGAGLDVDGGFGAKTLAAVKSYQSSRGLDVDGVVGPKTWAALESEYRR